MRENVVDTATHLHLHRYSLLFLSNSLCFLAKLQVPFFTESNKHLRLQTSALTSALLRWLLAQKMPPIKLELQHVLLTKQNNSSLLFMHLKKAPHPTLVRRNKMSFLRSFISRAQHPTHVRNNKMSLLKLLQRKDEPEAFLKTVNLHNNCGGRWFKKLRSSTDLPISWFTRKTLLQLKQLKLRRRQARGTFVLSTLQSYCTAKAIEERAYIFHLRNLTTSPHIDSDIADCLNLPDCLNLSIDNAYLVENPGALDNAKLLAIYTADNFSSPEHHCQPSSAPHLIQLSYIFAPQMLVLGPGNAWPAFTMDGQWRILETEVSNMDAKDTLQ
ncbi:hypothetical protein KY290_034150 [Solanum tuberosum]|uniref:Uncharacterized protein n=1 Tax=Solanum tuberosum TaxID=4113 RepID=A0ABQ7U4D0_SOLTU|nr:hypothetical protein KY289_034818 [Solanum tuberosum]KAH0741107.1 hypothetical protein KY290_034150 [Solanum tuberosum]